MTSRHRVLCLLPLLVVLSLGATCPRHPDPEARAAQYADEFLIRVGELQAAAISANSATPPGLSDTDAIAVVRFTTAAAKTIQATPFGWVTSFRVAYAEVKARLGTNAALLPLFVVIDGLLDALGSVQ